MICSNAKCEKNFTEPLELYNGTSACPFCKHILAIGPFSVTKENEELFNLSELCFLRYLSPNSVKSKDKTIKAEEQAKLLESAIDYCKQSMLLGNPSAIYKMGYYNERYLEKIRGETERIKKAFDYYSAICFASSKDFKAERGVKFCVSDFTVLQKKSANDLLRLIEKYPHILKGLNKYDYSLNREKIEKLYGATIKSGIKDLEKKSKIEYIKGLLTSCISGHHSALFGLYRLSKQEITDLFSYSGFEEKKSKNFIAYLPRGLEIRYLPCEDDGSLDIKKDRRFIRFSDYKNVQKRLDEIEESGCNYVYLYFFNTCGKHKFLTAGQMKTVYAELEKDDYELIKTMIDVSRVDQTFYDDDIEFYKKGRVTGCAKKLINDICEGE